MLKVASPPNSLGDRAGRSDDVLTLVVDFEPGDFGALKLKKGDMVCKPGLMGEVAVGMKNGSTTGRVTAVCSAVRNRRGPAGFGMTITSGIRTEEPPAVGARID